jgi:hypothetical protein
MEGRREGGGGGGGGVGGGSPMGEVVEFEARQGQDASKRRKQTKV